MVMASAPGKVHLIGEHAVVYGEPAIITAIGKRTFVEAEKRDGTIKIDDEYMDMHPEFSVQEALDMARKLDEFWKEGSEKKDFKECHDLFVDNYLKAVVGKSMQLLGIDGGLYLKISGDVPLGAGLGSSASLAIALLKATAEAYGIDLPLEKNNEMAYEIEKYAHGAPSGGDNSTCCFGGLVWFKKNMQGGPHIIQSLKEEIPYELENFVLVYSKEPELTTGQLVQKVMGLDPSFRDPIVKAISNDTLEMKEVLKRKDITRMKELINRTQENLAKLGVSVPEIDRICEAVRSIGGAAKGCGALGGGVVLCYHEDKNKLTQTIKDLGFEPWETELGVDGVRVEDSESKPSSDMVKVSAPGKLFLSGEWSVLEVGNPGIVTTVNKRVHAEARESQKISVTIDDYNIKDLGASFDGKTLEWDRELSGQEAQDTMFIKGAIETAGQYLGGLKPFSIRSWGDETQVEIDGAVKKVGFGSSAASVVANVSALLRLHGQDIESLEAKERIYKLSAIAHYLIQGKVGSAFDVAASTYGGVFVYHRFDPNWLMEKLESGVSIKDIVDQEWPSFRAEPVEIPEGFELLIGWTRESASTSAMVKQLNTWAETNREEYKRLYDQIADLVRELIPAWKEKNREKILELIRKNEDYLRELGEKSGVNIETGDLRLLSSIANRNGGAGKLSGAGGGDCGIAVCFDKEASRRIREEWKNQGLYLIDATIDYEGVKSE